MRVDGITELLNRVATQWSENLLLSLPSTLALFLVVVLLCRWRRLAPRDRALLWWMLCLKIVVAFLPLTPLTLATPLPQLAPGPQRTFLRAVGLGATEVPLEEATPAQTNAPTAAPITPTLSPTAWIFVGWLVIAVSLALSQIGKAARLRELRAKAQDLSETRTGARLRVLAAQFGLSAPPALLASEAVSAPFVTGLRSPVILLPIHLSETLSDEEMEMVLAHELAHLSRRDLWLAWVPHLARAVAFFVPFLPGYIVRQWETCREADCDRAAVGITASGIAPYSRLLLKIVGLDTQAGRHAETLGATTAFHTLHARIESLTTATPTMPVAAGLALVPLALLALIPLRLVPSASEAGIGTAPATLFPLSSDMDDVRDVPTYDIRIGGDPKRRYLLVGQAPDTTETAPAEGYRLLVVLPGGAGQDDFNPFIRRIHKRALGPRYIIVQLIAPQWDDRQKEEIVWPTRTDSWPAMRFATEDLIRTTIQDVSARFPVDPRHIYALGWASGGPAVYAAALQGDVPLRGVFVAMSAFDPIWLPSFNAAKGKAFFLLHPKDAPVVPFTMAEQAAATLTQYGATVETVGYTGGYGWSGDVYAQIRRGIGFLEQHSQ